MDFKNIKVTEVLRVENVELYRTLHEKATRLQRGDMVLLYCQEYDWYIIKINDWNYGLNKEIPLLASNQESDSIRAYVLADVDGYFVIKISNGLFGDLDRLDAILKQNTQFAYKEGANGHGLPVEVNHETVRVKRVMSEGVAENPDAPFNLAHTIYKGGKSVKEGIINTAEVVSVNLEKFGDYLQKDVLPKREEKKINPKTLSRMNWVNSATGMVNSASTFYIQGLMSLSRSIAQKLEAKFEKKKHDQEVAKIKEDHEKNMTQKKEEYEFTGNVIHASIHAGLGLWHGMVEALDIMRQGFTKTTTDVITHSYGQGAGELFEAGVGIVGNVGLPGARYFKAANRINNVVKVASMKKA